MEKINNKFQEYKLHIQTAFDKAEKYESKISQEILDIEGMTGKKTRHFYNNLLNGNDFRYLEVGCWKGSSVCSAMYKNKSTVVCIDNFSEFGGPKQDFLNNFEKFKGDNNATFIESDCFVVNINNLPMFNIYMYDGIHNYENHLNALKYFYNSLDDIFIFIVDDWNWERVRNGTMDAIKELQLEILYEKEIRLTNNEHHTPEPLASETWWNGIYVSILFKPFEELK